MAPFFVRLNLRCGGIYSNSITFSPDSDTEIIVKIA